MASSSHSVNSSRSSLALPLATPIAKQARRMTVPNMPPANPLGLPEPVYGSHHGSQTSFRPPSPLRHELTDDDSDSGSDTRSKSPAPSNASISKFAATFAQRVNSLIASPSKPALSSLPSDAELEAAAERERDHSRREAEHILMKEARERRMVEERVLALIGDAPAPAPPAGPITAPTTPVRSHTLPPAGFSPVSPALSQRSNKDKDAPGWWIAAKARLTPTKDPLTPAQQIIQETKVREKERRKADRSAERAQRKTRESAWPAKPESKLTDPAFLSLATTPSPERASRALGVATGSPSPGQPQRARRFSTPASLTASPVTGGKDGAATSGARDGPPLYAHFDDEGTLDVPGTLLVVAARFEKLERWTVGHVRALEERMGDVERWLVEKERERGEERAEREAREQIAVNGSASGSAHRNGGGGGGERVDRELDVLRDEIGELQGRIGELGREMAKLAAGAAAASPQPQPANRSSSFAVRSISPQATHIPRTPSTRSQGTTSPPASAITTGNASVRTRLPYPTGDYATPPESAIISQGAFSPTSPPVISPTGTGTGRTISGLPRSDSPTPANGSATDLGHPARGLSPPAAPALRTQRHTSISPTPRKRYTVALGASITGADRDREQEQEDERDWDRPATPSVRRVPNRVGTAFFTDAPVAAARVGAAGDEADISGIDTDCELQEETIGKAAARRVVSPASTSSSAQRNGSGHTSSPRGSERRARAQSAYGFSSIAGAGAGLMSPALSDSGTAPLKVRSRSTDRFSLNLPAASDSESSLSALGLGGVTDGRFVDPYEARRAEKERLRSVAPPTPKVMAGKKVPVGQLVAFFDQSNR